jgi:2-polyprenyl-6-methoxyphenol hydroxylase-like FAD-dependent oxidoreductase
MEYSTVVVGGGPAGSTVAAVLARNGISVLLVDDMGYQKEFKVGFSHTLLLLAFFATYLCFTLTRLLLSSPFS